MNRGPRNELFRREVFEHRYSNSQISDIIKFARIPGAALLGGSAFLFLAVIIIIFTADYTQKVRVTGQLVPDIGLVQVLAPRTGTVEELFVSIGQKVAANQRVASLSTRTIVEDGAVVSEEVSQFLEQEIEALEKRQAQARRSHLAVRNSLQQQLGFLDEQESATRKSLQAHSERLLTNSEIFETIERAYKEHSIPKVDYLKARAELLFDEAQYNDLSASLSRLQATRHGVLRQLMDSERLASEEEQEIGGDILQAKQSVMRVEGGAQNTLISPVDGYVTNIFVSAGESIPQDQPVVYIVPDGAKLEAELFLASTVVGRVLENSEISLQYDSFPFQEYGSYTARILYISEVAESGYAKGPVFRARAELLTYEIRNAPDYRLRPGMGFEAEIRLQTTPLYRWLILPFQAYASSALG